MNPKDLESFISGAMNGGWEMFKQLDPEIQKQIKVQQELSKEESKAVARAWAEFYDTPGGKKALDALAQSTLCRAVYMVSLGVDFQSMAVYGAFREGQNALAQEIARQIGLGRNEKIKPRDAKEI